MSTLAQRHAAEIRQLIDAAHASLESVKPYAAYRGLPSQVKPQGWTRNRGRSAKRKISQVFAQLSKDMRAAVARQRAESNPPTGLVVDAFKTGTPTSARPSRRAEERRAALH